MYSSLASTLLFTAMGNSHAIWDHTVLPATQQRWESCLYQQPKQVLDLATPEGCKAELTYVTWKPPARNWTRDLQVASPTPYRWATTHLCVCVSVCLWAYVLNCNRDLYQFLVFVAYVHGSVFFRRGEKILRRRRNFWGFLPYWQCTVWAL